MLQQHTHGMRVQHTNKHPSTHMTNTQDKHTGKVVEASEKSANFCPHEGLLCTTTLRVCNKRININGRHTLNTHDISTQGRFWQHGTQKTEHSTLTDDCP